MPNYELLTHPNIPKPLHGIAPRVIMGKEWWDIERKKAYENANFCCEACGVKKSEAKYHKWLEAHEYYEYDYKNGRLIFKKLVALCHSCHNFIHSGRMAMLVERGEMPYTKMQDILNHGRGLIKKAGINLKQHNGPSAKWEDWRMIFDGKEYGPSSTSFEDWQKGVWRDWKP